MLLASSAVNNHAHNEYPVEVMEEISSYLSDPVSVIHLALACKSFYKAILGSDYESDDVKPLLKQEAPQQVDSSDVKMQEAAAAVTTGSEGGERGLELISSDQEKKNERIWGRLYRYRWRFAPSADVVADPAVSCNFHSQYQHRHDMDRQGLALLQDLASTFLQSVAKSNCAVSTVPAWQYLVRKQYNNPSWHQLLRSYGDRCYELFRAVAVNDLEYPTLRAAAETKENIPVVAVERHIAAHAVDTLTFVKIVHQWKDILITIEANENATTAASTSSPGRSSANRGKILCEALIDGIIVLNLYRFSLKDVLNGKSDSYSASFRRMLDRMTLVVRCGVNAEARKRGILVGAGSTQQQQRQAKAFVPDDSYVLLLVRILVKQHQAAVADPFTLAVMIYCCFQRVLPGTSRLCIFAPSCLSGHVFLGIRGKQDQHQFVNVRSCRLLSVEDYQKSIESNGAMWRPEEYCRPLTTMETLQAVVRHWLSLYARQPNLKQTPARSRVCGRTYVLYVMAAKHMTSNAHKMNAFVQDWAKQGFSASAASGAPAGGRVVRSMLDDVLFPFQYEVISQSIGPLNE